MRERPWLLVVLSVSFLFLSAVPFLRIFYFYGLDSLSAQVPAEIFGTEFVGYLLIGTCGSLLAWNASRSVILFLPVLCLIALLEGYGSFYYAESLLRVPPNFWAASIFLMCQPLWFTGKARQFLLQPTMCWWKTPPRVESNAPAHVRTGLGQSYVSRVLNLSSQGLLLDIKTTAGEVPSFMDGQLLDLRFLLGPLSVVHCRAEVVRRDEIKGASRYGVRIIQMKSDSRDRIKKYLNHASAA